jgi:tagatose 6-phosphate kinase
MILSAGLTPAWQQIMVFERFRWGEVNRAREVHWHAQGKVLNAGIAAHHLGGPSLTLAPLGGPPLTAIERELAELGVPHHWIETQAATRVCTTLIDRASGKITELVENARPLTPDELDAYLRAYAEEAARADVVVLTGSLPVGTPPSYYRALVEKTPCPMVLDFRGEGLLGVLDLKPYVVKPNREELAQTFGWPLDEQSALLDAMRTLNARGAQWAVISQGANPVWITSADHIYKLHPLPETQIVSPIGSGDAMAAAIAWATREGKDIVQSVRLGIAAAAENLRQLTTCRLDPARIRQRASEVVFDQSI